MDSASPPPTASASPIEPPAYVYAPTDLGPRQTREMDLCAQASEADWLYLGGTAAAVVGSVYLNLQVLKQAEQPGVRLVGPGLVGLSWGMFLGGGYLSLPKCDPHFAWGAPPEGDIRPSWPLAVAIAMLAGASAPAIDYVFLGPVKNEWVVPERTGRVFVAMGTGVLGALLPYALPPRTWAAKKEIERIRLGQTAGGAFVSYTLSF